MKKLNENQKITLTLGQLRRLVRESTVEDWPKDNDLEGWARIGKAFPNTELQRKTLQEENDYLKETINFVQKKILELGREHRGEPVERELDDLFRYTTHRQGTKIGGVFDVENPYK